MLIALDKDDILLLIPTKNNFGYSIFVFDI